MEVEVVNHVGASIGDTVVIGFETTPLMKLTFLLYVFPIICMIIGALIGQSLAPRFDMGESDLSVIFSFASFLIAFLAIRFIGKQLSRQPSYRARIIRISNRAR